MPRELWRKSCGCWCYLQLADPAKIVGKNTNLQSLTKKVVRICTHSGKAVNEKIIDGGGVFDDTLPFNFLGLPLLSPFVFHPPLAKTWALMLDFWEGA
jgi:hypothetical protein